MGRFQGWDYAFDLRQKFECFERIRIGNRNIVHTLSIVEKRVFRADRGIIETSRDGMGCGDLADPDTEQFLEESGCRWLAKPFRLTDLLRAVKEGLS